MTGLPPLDIVIVLAVVASAAFAVYLYLMFQRGPRGRGQVADQYLAVAHCSVCGKDYECEWIPSVSYSSLRWGSKRYQKCLACHTFGWSTFVRWAPPGTV